MLSNLALGSEERATKIMEELVLDHILKQMFSNDDHTKQEAMTAAIRVLHHASPSVSQRLIREESKILKIIFLTAAKAKSSYYFREVHEQLLNLIVILSWQDFDHLLKHTGCNGLSCNQTMLKVDCKDYLLSFAAVCNNPELQVKAKKMVSRFFPSRVRTK